MDRAQVALDREREIVVDVSHLYRWPRANVFSSTIRAPSSEFSLAGWIAAAGAGRGYYKKSAGNTAFAVWAGDREQLMLESGWPRNAPPRQTRAGEAG